jgi:galactoside O-acetyltransferase/maltose O-acetyltransferase
VLQAVNGGKIIIGNHFGASGISIVSNISVIIGDNVRCGTNVMIGDRNGHERIYPDWQPKPVTIGNNVWIGMNSIVMRGVTIGNNSIIGAGSIVTKDIPSNVIAAGIPCRVIRER